MFGVIAFIFGFIGVVALVLALAGFAVFIPLALLEVLDTNYRKFFKDYEHELYEVGLERMRIQAERMP